jgi:putative ABC transport system permease protein
VILFLKAVRAIWNNKKAYLSCVVLVAVAIYMMVAMGSAAEALAEASERYYKSNRLADVFANVNSFPASAVSSLAQIEGINEIQARLVYDARVNVPGNSKIIWLRLVSFDTSYEGVSLNYPDITGRPLEHENDIWIGHAFLDIHSLEVGGSLDVIIEGRKSALNIAGMADSPEYVYAVRDPSDLLPDNEAFGIAYIGALDLAVLLDKRGLYNDLTFSLDNGYAFDDVKEALTEALSPYGLTALYAKEDQFSYSMLNTEITSIQAMSLAVPVMFTLISAIVLFLMLKRVIEQERTQIGALKTFGYKNREILFHYLLYGLVTSVLGGALGVLLGNMSVKYLIDMYTEFFTLPDVRETAEPSLAAAGMALAAASGAIGAYFGAKPALRLAPADAMRPPSPPLVKGDIMKTLPFLRWLLTSRGSMSIRNIQRSKARSVFIVLGIAFSFGIMEMMCPMMTMMTDMIVAKYEYIQAYDAKLSLRQPANAEDAARQAMKLPGVTMAEAIREMPVEIRRSNRKTGSILMGLTPETQLYHIYDDETKQTLPFPDSGIILNTFAADELGVAKGAEVMLKTAWNEDEIPVIVRDIVHQNMTSAVYMDYDTVNNMLDLPDSADSVMVRTTDMEGVKLSLDDTKNISSIEDTYSAMTNFEQMMNSYSSMTWIMVVLGTVIAFAIIYNSATISLSEKKREYATLRVLGMHINEVCEISNFEYWLLFTIGCLLGIPFGRFMLGAMNEMMKTMMENMTLPPDVPLWAVGASFLGCMTAVLLSNLSAKRTIKKLDMVEVLKERE